VAVVAASVALIAPPVAESAAVWKSLGLLTQTRSCETVPLHSDLQATRLLLRPR
jgi:hypothetical protein